MLLVLQDNHVSVFFRQEALLAAISEKDANIALLELSSSKKKTQDEVAALKREKDRLVQQLKQQVGRGGRGKKPVSNLVWRYWRLFIWRLFCDKKYMNNNFKLATDHEDFKTWWELNSLHDQRDFLVSLLLSYMCYSM